MEGLGFSRGLSVRERRKRGGLGGGVGVVEMSWGLQGGAGYGRTW